MEPHEPFRAVCSTGQSCDRNRGRVGRQDSVRQYVGQKGRKNLVFGWFVLGGSFDDQIDAPTSAMSCVVLIRAMASAFATAVILSRLT